MLDRLLGDESVRPAIGWTNLEDVIYHDTLYGDRRLDDSPELAAFMQKVWVFNRSMRWVRPHGGAAVVAFESGAEVRLTGERQASAWHTGSANVLAEDGDATTWIRGSSRRRDGLVLPTFQVNLAQHPVLRVEVEEADADWQLAVSLKGRAGVPLWHGQWTSGPGRVTLPLRDLLTRAGYRHQFAELHLALVVWDPTTSKPRIRISAAFATEPALVAALPAVLTTSDVRGQGGFPVAAAVLDADGALVSPSSVEVVLETGGRVVPLTTDDHGLWIARVADLGAGDHDAVYRVTGAIEAAVPTVLRVTDGDFCGYDERTHLVRARGKLRPLSGSYAASTFVVYPGQPDERLLFTQDDWDHAVVAGGAEERVHHWDALNEDELHRKLGGLADAGFDVLHLHSHWSTWARLDAGGRISPHVAEQAALYYRVAAQHGLTVMQTLADYPYGVAEDRTQFNPDLSAPWSTYVDAGLATQDWYRPSGPFRELFERYVRDVVTLFGGETAILGLNHSGEADFMSGAGPVNQTQQLLRSCGDRHLFYSEAVFRIDREPVATRTGFDQDLVGGRTYWIGEHIAPTTDLGIEFKLMASAGIFMAEGSWAPANSFARLHRELGDRWGSRGSWTGTHAFRLRLRDSLYLSLVHRLPMAITWDEQISTDEHLVYRELSRAIDWSQDFAPAPVELVIGADHTTGIGREVLARHVRWAAENGVALAARTPGQAGAAEVGIEISGAFSAPPLDPEHSWVRVGPGYQASPMRSRDRRTVLAYLPNSGRLLNEYFMPGLWLHRMPVPAPLEVEVPLAVGPHRVRLFDLDARRAVLDMIVEDSAWRISRGPSTHDYALVVTPTEGTPS